MRRKSVYQFYFAGAAGFIVLVFWYSTTSVNFNIIRIGMIFFLGAFTQGIMAIHSFYLPEQYPFVTPCHPFAAFPNFKPPCRNYIRGRGVGLTYNASRLVTSLFPFIIGIIIGWGYSPLTVISFVAIVPALGVIFLIFPVAIETRNLDLYASDTDWEMEVDAQQQRREESQKKKQQQQSSAAMNGSAHLRSVNNDVVNLSDVSLDFDEEESAFEKVNGIVRPKVYPMWPPPPSAGIGTPGMRRPDSPWIIDEILDIDDGQGLGLETETIDGFVEISGVKKKRLHWLTPPQDYVDI